MGRSLIEEMAALAPHAEAALIEGLAERGVDLSDAMAHAWPVQARPEQMAPLGAAYIWLILAGRGFGKTRAGAEWVRQVAARDGSARIALVGATLHEARSVMVEGASGILSIGRASERPEWQPSLRRLRWASGAEAMLYGGAEADGLRGPQHSHGWCDEIAKWPDGEAVWDNLEMTMRLEGGGWDGPRIVATTTPRAVPLVRRLVAAAARPDGGVAMAQGRSRDNVANLMAGFVERLEQRIGGTHLGRQELDGEMIGEVDGALWRRDLIERCRVAAGAPIPALCRVVVGVDPPAGTQGDACGIVVVARDEGGIGHVLADRSVAGRTPEGWARAVAQAAGDFGADRVVAEANNGGAMVGSVLRAVDAGLPVRLVHASRGKSARAEPVAALYESGRVVHRAAFPALEDELCGMIAGGGYAGPGRSPDRADALVWAMSELMLGARGEARVRGV